MILPIIAYGDPVLRKKCVPITAEYPNLETLIENMFETMKDARGVGLAAPQVGVSIRLFIVDATPFMDDVDLTEEERDQIATFKKVFINPTLRDETGNEWAFNEGCLSIPDIREDVFRKPEIVIEYQDENFIPYKEGYNGLVARIIQHEYDHIEGILFTDKLSSLKKRLIKNKLSNISKGLVNVEYRMRFPNPKKKR